MKFTLIAAAALSSQLGVLVHAHPAGDSSHLAPRQACSKTEDCGSTPNCVGGMVSFVCDGGQCVCKSPDAPPPSATCQNDGQCNGAQLCATNEGYQAFCDTGAGTCSCRIPPPPVPYHTLKLSQTQISFGTSVNGDEGRAMKKALADALFAHCPEDKTECSNEPFDLGRIDLILNKGREYMNLQGTIDRSKYSNKESRDFMISLLTIGAIDATRGACERTGYHESVQGGIGCPDPDHTGLTYKRDLFAVPYKDPSPDYYIEEDASHLRARISDGQVDKPERWCNYVTNMCAGPKTLYTINGRSSDPYEDDLQIRFELVSPPNGMSDVAKWFCEAGLGLLSDLALGKLPSSAANFLGVAGIPDDPIDIICGENTGPEPEEFDV
ncbi:hypothetical protein CC79DRAFT_1373006 [Sarocladium strictum]